MRAPLSVLGIALVFSAAALAQTRPDLVSREKLRVCADPANLPYADKAKQGFENRIAEIVADELKLPLRYFWMPQGPGFVRNTLGEGMCDLIVGYAAEFRRRRSFQPLLRLDLCAGLAAGFRA